MTHPSPRQPQSQPHLEASAPHTRVTARRRWLRHLAPTWLLAVLAGLVTASPADAAPAYSTYPGSVWNVRSCAGTCDVVGTISGTIEAPICQDLGPSVSVAGYGTSTVYDLVRLPGTSTLGYVSDLGIQQTRYATFTPGIPRCTAASSYVAGSITQQGYTWVLECAAKALFNQKKGACWVAGGKYLFTPAGTAG